MKDYWIIGFFVLIIVFATYMAITEAPKEIAVVKKSNANSHLNYLKNMEKAKIISVDMDEDSDGYVKITFRR